ncbi:flagellar hook-length control protein FliK [Arthrobacter sp. CAN_A212]|uniref:flagellar hook-length control protein FliK n=1 Tax=Arthrobacter sp. CAN_A212 TaxID=2787719 RepID=UPI001A19FC89
MSALATVGGPAPKGAPSTTAKSASDGGAAFGPALTLARELLDPPTVRSGAGSRATPGPSLPVDPSATGAAAGEAAGAAFAALPGSAPGSSPAPTPVGMPALGPGATLHAADPATQAETGTIPTGSTLAQGLPEDRATFLSRATQGTRVEASAAHVPTALPPAGGAHFLPPVVAAPAATGSGDTPAAGSPTQSTQIQPAQTQPAQTQSVQPTPVAGSQTQLSPGADALGAVPPAVAAPAAPGPAGAPLGVPGAGLQGVPPVPAALSPGSTASSAPAAEPSATVQPAVPAAQLPAQHSPALQVPVPAASAPPAPPPPVPLATQLYKPVFSLANASKGEHLITVRVAPDELGPVTVRAVVTAEGMRVELFAPTEAARDALRGMLPDLRRDLATPGLHASLDVSTKDQPGGGDSARGHADGQGPARQDHGRPDRTREPPLPAGSPTGDPESGEAGPPGGTPWNRSTLDLLA